MPSYFRRRTALFFLLFVMYRSPRIEDGIALTQPVPVTRHSRTFAADASSITVERKQPDQLTALLAVLEDILQSGVFSR